MIFSSNALRVVRLNADAKKQRENGHKFLLGKDLGKIHTAPFIPFRLPNTKGFL